MSFGWFDKLCLTALVAALYFSGCSTPTSRLEPSPSQIPELKPSLSVSEPAGGQEMNPGKSDQKVLQSNISRDTSPVVVFEDLDNLVDGNSAFAFDFYQVVCREEGNLFFSPHSLSTALVMTYAGAEGNTASQMANTLHFNLPPQRLHPAFNALDLALVNHDIEAEGSEVPQDVFQLKIANSLWGQQDYPFLPDFLDTLALNYGAGLLLVDFLNAPEPARKEINHWVEKQTQEKIKDLVPPGAINAATTLVLANAIYFKADWLYPFSPEITQPANFYPLDGSPVEIPMMAFSQPVSLPYYKDDGYQAVEMPYRGNQVSMLVFVPDQGEFARFEAALDELFVDSLDHKLASTHLMLSLPKFSFDSGYSLAEVLAGMGMADAFHPGKADFSGMDGTRLLFISDVFHKAFVAVDEKGTEAAAATAVIVGRTALMEPEVVLVVDRPFIFLIRDKETGAILFIGRVVSPSAAVGK